MTCVTKTMNDGWRLESKHARICGQQPVQKSKKQIALGIFQEDHWYIWHIYLITAFSWPILQSLGSKSYNVTKTW
jgi:hypothetical protein